ncbi:MAG TPA: hypothetical protein VFK11_04880 [Candidatus Saccharimonadales bacterium]|nr:hypothetical protein [Candidatus Saccharimonadales bacterium]
MIQQRKLTQFLSGLGALALIFIMALQILPTDKVYANAITNIKLTLQTGTTPSDVDSDGIDDGGSMPGGNANHYFQFSVPSSSNVDAIQFKYCTTELIPSTGNTCTAPTGLDSSTSTLGLDAGTGWTITNQTANTVTVSGSAANLSGNKTFRLDDVVNPTTTNETFYVYIATYTGGTSGTLTDDGSAAASTATPIQLTGTMPESLVFCTGETISKTGGVPDCTTATSGDISFNQLFDPTSTAHATSQMAASTNAGSGYAIAVNGPTLTSGSNTISAIGGTATSSTLGTSQFGMNLAVNTTPAVGSAIDPASNGTNYLANAQANFDTADSFAFDDTGNNTVAASDNGGTAGPTDSQIYTASYIVNVPGSQPAGTYTTTLTYICTPTF